MRRVSNKPRQVRKEAAVVGRSVCCGVPGLFCVSLKSVNNFSLCLIKIISKRKIWQILLIKSLPAGGDQKQFSELVGQDHVVKTLGNAIDLGRIAHAYLLSVQEEW